jgi:hypothetical protein
MQKYCLPIVGELMEGIQYIIYSLNLRLYVQRLSLRALALSYSSAPGVALPHKTCRLTTSES